MTQTTVNSYFQQLISDFVEKGIFPDTNVEASLPSLAAKINTPSDKFSFDNFIHSSQTPSWSLKPLNLPTKDSSRFGLDAPVFVYLPAQWQKIECLENACQIYDETGNTVKQTIYLIDKHKWKETLIQFFSQKQVCGFVYYLIQPRDFHQFICCIEEGNRLWICGFYTAGDKILVTKADATDTRSLDLQLTSLINSNPWYGYTQK